VELFGGPVVRLNRRSLEDQVFEVLMMSVFDIAARQAYAVARNIGFGRGRVVWVRPPPRTGQPYTPFGRLQQCDTLGSGSTSSRAAGYVLGGSFLGRHRADAPSSPGGP
jgi:hypothetical protein